MKIIYYTTAYYSTHGGSLHSQAFVREARKHKCVDRIIVFPEYKRFNNKISEGLGRSKLRLWLRKLALLQVFFFYRRNDFHYTRLVEFIEEQQPDILHIRIDANFLQINKIRARYPDLVISTEVNSSCFEEGFNNIAFKSYFKRLERNALCKADFNFFVSDFLRLNIMSQKVKGVRDKVVHNGVDEIFYRLGGMNIIEDSDDLILIYIGTIDHHKKIKDLIQAFYLLCDIYPHIKLHVIGDGPALEETKIFSKTLSVEDRIVFFGWVTHDKIPNELAKAHIAIHHYAEKYMSPLKLFEYMSMELPVVGPDTPSVLEVFKNEEHLLVTNGEVNDIVKKLQKLIENKAFSRVIARNGHQLVVDNYTWEHNCDFIINNLNYLLKNK